MSFTFSSILSIGFSTSLVASLVNIIEAMESTIQTNNVLHIDSIDSTLALDCFEKKATNSKLSFEKRTEELNSSVLRVSKEGDYCQT